MRRARLRSESSRNALRIFSRARASLSCALYGTRRRLLEVPSSEGGTAQPRVSGASVSQALVRVGSIVYSNWTTRTRVPRRNLETGLGHHRKAHGRLTQPRKDPRDAQDFDCRARKHRCVQVHLRRARAHSVALPCFSTCATFFLPLQLPSEYSMTVPGFSAHSPPDDRVPRRFPQTHKYLMSMGSSV